MWPRGWLPYTSTYSTIWLQLLQVTLRRRGQGRMGTVAGPSCHASLSATAYRSRRDESHMRRGFGCAWHTHC